MTWNTKIYDISLFALLFFQFFWLIASAIYYCRPSTVYHIFSWLTYTYMNLSVKCTREIGCLFLCTFRLSGFIYVLLFFPVVYLHPDDFLRLIERKMKVHTVWLDYSIAICRNKRGVSSQELSQHPWVVYSSNCPP